MSDDKAHDAFKGTLKGKLDDVHVVDFTPGVFEAASKACKWSKEVNEQQQQLTYLLYHCRVT